GEGKDGDVAPFLDGAVRAVHGSEEHLEREQKQDDAAGELEREEMDSHRVEDDLAEDDGADEDDRGVGGRAAGDAAAVLAGESGGQACEEREVADRVDGRPDEREVAKEFSEHGVLRRTIA